MAEYKANDLMPVIAENCHVCGEPLRHNKWLMKERCVNPACQVFQIHFNILHLPRDKT